MSDAAATRPRAIFKRETKGLITAAVAVQLERSRLLLFAKLLGETAPLFTNVAAARASGHPDIAAAPSFAAVIETLAEEERSRQGGANLTELIGCDFRYLLHAEQHHTYEGLMYAGEEVLVSTLVLDFYEKREGSLEFAVLESTISHAQRGVLVRVKRTLVHRLE